METAGPPPAPHHLARAPVNPAYPASPANPPPLAFHPVRAPHHWARRSCPSPALGAAASPAPLPSPSSRASPSKLEHVDHASRTCPPRAPPSVTAPPPPCRLRSSSASKHLPSCVKTHLRVGLVVGERVLGEPEVPPLQLHPLAPRLLLLLEPPHPQDLPLLRDHHGEVG